MFLKKYKKAGLALSWYFLLFGCASEKGKQIFGERDEIRSEEDLIREENFFDKALENETEGPFEEIREKTDSLELEDEFEEKEEEALSYWPEIFDKEEIERTREEDKVEEIKSDFGSTEDAEELTEIDEIETSDEVESEVEEKEEEIAQPKWDWLGYLDYPQEAYVSQEVEEGGEIKHDLSWEDFVSRDFTQEDGSSQELPGVFLDYLEGGQSDKEQEKDSSQDFPEESGFEHEEVPQEAEVNEPSPDLLREQYQSDDFNSEDSVSEDIEEEKESDRGVSDDFGLETQSDGELEVEVREEVCQPDCDNKECGDDGCGGICGACDDGISCTVDYCDDFQCHFAPLDSLCSDNIDCTVDKCSPSGCQNIPDDSRCGFSEYCWPWKGGCVYVECFSDDDCSDDNLCNGIEQCDVLTYRCLGGIALECDDGNLCNGRETCDPLLGCQAGVPLVCDDGNICNGLETCDPLEGCQAGEPLVCDDGDICNGLETCDPTYGCQQGLPLSCDDGLWCNGSETCDAVMGCLPGIPPILSDNIACTEDVCDEENDVVLHIPNDALCDDGLWCNGVEVCDISYGCIQGKAPELSDGIDCTVDLCDEENDTIVHLPNHALCSDNNICNGVEVCDPTVGCQPGIPLSCDDGLWCNGFETCNPLLGCQAGIPPILSDGIDCTIDFCDEENDKIVHLPDDSLCDDHNPCTLDFCNVLSGCQHLPKDSDQDGFIDANCPLGSDCNDNDSSINPAAQDTVGDGIDQNCDGLDGVDADHDGYPSIDSGGSDCDDNNPLINPGRAHDPIEVRVEENVELDQNIGVGGTREQSIMVDSQGYPHLSWQCVDNGTGVCPYSEVRYIEKSSAGWSPIYLIYGFAAQVLLDPQENVHIIYLTLDRGYCFNRWRKLRSDGSWLYDRLFCENDGWVGFHSEVFDSQGYLHIAYQDDLNTILTYATNVSGSWVVTDIDNGNEKKANAGNHPLIVLDSRGKAHIVSVLSGTVFDTEVRYSTNESGNWTTRTLYPEPSALGILGIDFLDRLHLIWRISPTEARYSKKENGQWNEYFIDSAAKEPGFITREGIVFMGYWGYGCLKFVTNLSGTWERTGEIISCNMVRAVSRDSFGKLHTIYILYHEGNPPYYSLHYARLAIFNTVDENCDGR